jgi:type III secretion protein V
MKITKEFIRISRASELWLFLAIFLVLAVLVLPVPTVVIDGLLAVSICSSLLMVVFAVRVQSPTELSTFPSVLLILTVFRLSVDVAVARSVLVSGDAGQLVVIFGKFVAGGNVGIGLMVFLIISVVQFIVIAKGSERVAEVAARFTLDGLPGRQMSIDADLRNGAITEERAVELRAELEKETQFHGAMDGAVRFVKGDVIAGLIIVFIILVGGIGVGVMSRNLDLGDAIDRYSILTIGGGLLSQIGSVLSALAAALLITRSSKDGRTDLGTNLIRQFSNYPTVLIVVGVGACVLATVPGLPAVPFIACGIALFGFGTYLQRKRNAAGLGALHGDLEVAGKDATPFELFSARNAPHTAGAIRVGISKNLGLASVLQGIGEGYAKLVLDVQVDMGIALQQLEIVVLEDVAVGTYTISLHGNERARGRFDVLCGKDGETGVSMSHTLKGQVWLWAASEHSAANDGVSSKNVSQVQAAIVEHIRFCVLRNLNRVPTVGDIKKMLSSGGKDYANMLADVTRNVPLIRVCGIVRRLIEEGVPLHNVRACAAGLVVANPAENDDAAVVQSMRLSLRDGICSRLVGGGDRLELIEVSEHLEYALCELSDEVGPHKETVLSTERVNGLREQFLVLCQRSERQDAKWFAVVVNPETRVPAIEIIKQIDPRASVITWDEINDEVSVCALGTLE